MIFGPPGLPGLTRLPRLTKEYDQWNHWKKGRNDAALCRGWHGDPGHGHQGRALRGRSDEERCGKDGYNAVQLGLVEDNPIRLKKVTKPLRGHFEKTGGGLPPTRVLKEIRLADAPEATVGDQIKVDVFADGDKVEVVGRSKGKGFAGTIKRHGFARGPESHGSMNVRKPGSIGQSAYPSRVIKGTKSSGHMGDERVTIKGLTVAKVDAENNLLMVRGAVPGANGSVVIVKKS